MPIGAAKVGLFGAGAEGNYFGDESLGDCQFSSGSITQTGETVDIDTVLTTGSETGGTGTSSYGKAASGPQAGGVPYSTAVYEFTVPNHSGTYDGDMVVLNFTNLTVDASLTLTTERACRGMLIYCSGDATINGAISMSCRGGHADPTASGGSDSSAVSSTGLRLPMFTASGTDTLAAADFAGSGNDAVNAVANQPGISGDGSIFTMNQLGGTGGPSGVPGGGGSAGPTGANTIGTGGGASGKASGGSNVGKGGDGGAFSAGASSGSVRHASSGAGGDYGGAGTVGAAGAGGEGVAGGSGNPGAAGVYGGGTGGDGVGGIIWIIVKGDITIGGSGTIQGHGSPGAHAGYYGGSGSGGGSVMVLYGGTASNVIVDATIDAQGGGGGSGIHAGHGGARGGTQAAQVSK